MDGINNSALAEDDHESDRTKLIDERRQLLIEQQTLKDKDEALNVAEVTRLFEIQERMSAITEEIENSMQMSLNRSLALSSFGKQQGSTPGVRRSMSFAEESAIQSAIEKSSLSKNLLHIDPCKPSEGSNTISAANYQRWQKLLLRTTESLTEEEKESFFLKSAGPELMDILEMLTDQSQDSASETPFSDILSCLDTYFKSDGVKTEACSEFEAMKRNASKGESNVAYLDRIAKAAKNCGFAAHEFDKRLMTVVARNTDDERVRKAAIEVDFNGKYRTYVQFRNHLRHLDLVQNIGLANVKASTPSKELSVHAVEGAHSSKMARSSYQPYGARSFNFRDPSRARPAPFMRSEGDLRFKQCHRCGGGHDAASCPCRMNTCFKCGRVGHMKAMCGKFRPDKRSLSQEKRGRQDGEKRPRVQKVENVETKQEVNQ